MCTSLELTKIDILTKNNSLNVLFIHSMYLYKDVFSTSNFNYVGSLL